jgi:hypothetical protein
MPSDVAPLEIAQQAPPPDGYTVARFEAYIDALALRLAEMEAAGDFRAVFQLTYLTFSRCVLAALRGGRFDDGRWAADMCCRFVEVYLHQLALWDAGDARLCRPWRMAFEAMKEKRANLMQAMLLGMNAHINYDLAFVTLGACRHAGDLPEGEEAAERSLSLSRGGVPVVRYRDFLLVNRIGWESIPLIQDTVLGEFSRVLYWGNRATFRLTRHLGQRVLLEARDASWCQTCLLVHARDDGERALVARLIDGYAASVADLIGMLTLRPARALDSASSWRRRAERLEPEVQEELVRMAVRNPVIAELAVHELAFAGADPVPVTRRLIAAGEPRLAGIFGQMVLRLAPAARRRRLRHFLQRGSDEAVDAIETMVDARDPLVELPRGGAMSGLGRRWETSAHHARQALAWEGTSRVPHLREALREHLARLEAALAELPRSGRAPTLPDAGNPDALRDYLARHPDPWVRLLAGQVASAGTKEPAMSLIERVLFLKDTPMFMEVEPGVLVHVAEKLVPEAFPAGASIVRSGVKSGGIRIVRSGEVRVSQVRDGQPVAIATLGPRDALGELSALNDTQATADCTAAGAVETYFLPGPVLAALLHQHPRLGLGLIRVLSQRLMTTTRLVSGGQPAAGPAAAISSGPPPALEN